MPSSDTLLFLLALAGGFGLLLTRVARVVAARVGMVDSPDGKRKMQPAPVPVAGGVAVFVAGLLALAGVAAVDPDLASVLTADPRKALALLAAAALLVAVGVIDDRVNLRA